jgi:fructokinase
MRRQIVGIGELLWDVFPDGPRFGGAPANFSCTAAELSDASTKVSLVSAIGDDELGGEAKHELASHQVDMNSLQVNSQATGQVLVELDSNGVASYRFAESSAWDCLQWNSQLNELSANTDAVCFGTLGQRSLESKATIRRFVESTPNSSLRILDVNLRSPFDDDANICESLELANILKLNDQELPRIAKLVDCAAENEVDALRALMIKFDLRYIALTCGENGANFMSQQELSRLPAPIVDVVDTVGAGDAYTAAMTLGILNGVSVEQINRYAIEVAAYVCSQRGATMKMPKRLKIGSSFGE